MTTPRTEYGTSASWMTRMPPFLLDAWHVGRSERLAPSEKLRVRLHLSWVGIRTLVGIVASAWEAVRPKDVPDEVGVLAFEKETWGTWLAYGEKAARATVRHAPNGPAAEFSQLLLPNSDGSVLADAKRIVEIRNRVYHGHFGGEVGPAEAEHALEELRGPLLKLITGLRLLGSHPIVWFEDPAMVAGKIKVRLVAALGQQSDSEVVDFREGLEGQVPFLLLSDGALLRLDPWIAVGRVGGRPVSSCGLVARRGKAGFEYETGAEPLVAERVERAVGASRILVGIVQDVQMSALLGVPNRPPPSAVGPFTVLRRLGHGATSVVYLVRDERGGAGAAELALKVLRPELAVDREVRERFRREAVAMSRIQHPGVVRVVDHGDDPQNGPWIAMEVVRNGSLADLAGVLPVRPHIAVRCAVQVLDALECVHKHGIIHRDVKPSNILLDGEQARLVDFGIARLGDAAGLTRSLHASGTLSFAAPEQLDGRPVDLRADIFGVGKVLKALVSGRDRMPRLHAVIRRATHMDPEHRFPTARAMREALQEPGLLVGEGAPVGAGDRLGDFHVTGTPEAVAPDVWVAEGEGPGRDGPRGLVLAFEPEAKTALDARVRALNRDARFRIGFDGISREEDALIVVLDRQPWHVYAAALFGGTVPPVGSIPAFVPTAAATTVKPVLLPTPPPASTTSPTLVASVPSRRSATTSPDFTFIEEGDAEPEPPATPPATPPLAAIDLPAVPPRAPTLETGTAAPSAPLAGPPTGASPGPLASDALPWMGLALGGLFGVVGSCPGVMFGAWVGWNLGKAMRNTASVHKTPPPGE